MFILQQIVFLCQHKKLFVIRVHDCSMNSYIVSDMWLSTYKVGASQLRSITEITQKSHLLCVIRSPSCKSSMVFIPEQKVSSIVNLASQWGFSGFQVTGMIEGFFWVWNFWFKEIFWVGKFWQVFWQILASSLI